MEQRRLWLMICGRKKELPLSGIEIAWRVHCQLPRFHTPTSHWWKIGWRSPWCMRMEESGLFTKEYNVASLITSFQTDIIDCDRSSAWHKETSLSILLSMRVECTFLIHAESGSHTKKAKSRSMNFLSFQFRFQTKTKSVSWPSKREREYHRSLTNDIHNARHTKPLRGSQASKDGEACTRKRAQDRMTV